MTIRRAAVLGSPIAHSRSPVLHRVAYAAMGLDWTYDAIDVTPAGLEGFLASCQAPEWVGLSLTMPLKTDVIPLLDEVSDLSQIVGAVNTVVFDGDTRTGHNTDVAGMVHALQECSQRMSAPHSAGVIGGGATARSALAALADLSVGHVDVVVRSPERARELVTVGRALDLDVTVHDWGSPARAMSSDVVISTVPAGVSDGLVGGIRAIPGVLLDVAYGDGQSLLVQAWRSRGGAAADGLDLLLWQAVDQIRIFTGRQPPIEQMRDVLQAQARPARGIGDVDSSRIGPG